MFPIIGVLLWMRGHENAEAKLHALRNGVATRGRLVAVTIDYNQHINRKHPWAIDYEVDTPTGPFRGRCTAWDPVNTRRPPGEHLWVVYDPQHPESHALWPPLR